MKKLTVIVLALLLIWAGYTETHYTKPNCEVVRVDNNLVYVVDRIGNEWCFEDTENTYKTGALVKLKMSTNGTAEYYEDDKIVKVMVL